MGLNVAIVGATGAVGLEFLKIMEQRKFPLTSLHLYATKRSAGKRLRYNGDSHEVRETTPDAFNGMDIAFISASSEASRRYCPMAAQAGAVAIDDSSVFRQAPDVPLVVPEVNSDDLKFHKGIVSTPNCTTVPMVLALAPLHRVNPIKRIVVSTYQSVSGAGSAAMDELTNEAKDILEGRKAIPHIFPHPIAFNIIPGVDVFMDSGYSKEEWKMSEEFKKIMHAPTIGVSATCVRVPVYIAHSEAVHVEFTRPMQAEEARRLLSEMPGVKLMDEPSINLYPHPRAVAGTDEVCVGRIRQDVSHPCGLAMWIVADNLRKGAALNAIQIAEALIKNKYLRK